MNKNFTVRFPSQTNLPINSEEAKFWEDRISGLSEAVQKNRIDIRQSSGDINIRLAAGGNQGVHYHNKKSEAFGWFGIPTPGELMKAISAVVGIQVMDSALHIPVGSKFNNLDVDRVKPNILYLPDDTPNIDKNGYNLLHEQLKILTEAGTIGKNDPLDRIFRIVRTPEEFVDALHDQKPIKQSIQSDQKHTITIPEEELKIGTHYKTKKQKPEFCGIVYTSANPRQTQIAKDEGQLIGSLFAGHGIGLITGAGNSGIMGEVGNGCFRYGGFHIGFQCPYIVKQEGYPEGVSILNMTPDIYTRMGGMFKEGEFAIIAGGGRGGGGTLQEALVGLYLLTSRLNRYGQKNREERLGYSKIAPNKPIEIIFDNREELWGPTIKMYELNGLEQGKNFHIGKGSIEVFEHVLQVKERVYQQRNLSSRTNQLSF